LRTSKGGRVSLLSACTFLGVRVSVRSAYRLVGLHGSRKQVKCKVGSQKGSLLCTPYTSEHRGWGPRQVAARMHHVPKVCCVEVCKPQSLSWILVIHLNQTSHFATLWARSTNPGDQDGNGDTRLIIVTIANNGTQRHRASERPLVKTRPVVFILFAPVIT
jgi:hypothetical protein